MDSTEAYAIISDGHGLISVEKAEEVCKFFEVKFDDYLILSWKGQKDANPTNDYKGIHLHEDKPGKGVTTLALSTYIARQLGAPSSRMFGRGFMARENAYNVRILRHDS